MKTLKLALIAGVAVTAAGFASVASAETSYNAGVASDYVFRGVDQLPFGDGQIFAGVDYTKDKFYAGAWVSNTAGDSVEYDLYAGAKFPLSGATLDLGVIYYGYTDGAFGSSSLKTIEYKAAISVPAGAFTVGAAAYYSTDFFNSGDSGLYLEGNAAYTFPNKVSVSGAIGQQQIEAAVSPDSYVTYNVGVTFPLNDKLSLDARYIAVDKDGKTLFGSDDKVVGTLKAVF